MLNGFPVMIIYSKKGVFTNLPIIYNGTFLRNCLRKKHHHRCLIKYPAGNYMFKVNKQKHQNKVRNMFKVNNKDTRTTSYIFKVNNKDTRTTPVRSFWYLNCYPGTYFTPCSSISVVNFDHVIASWVLLNTHQNSSRFFLSETQLFSTVLKKAMRNIFYKIRDELTA